MSRTCSVGSQIDDIGMPPPDRNGGGRGKPVFDGEQGLEASCTVKDKGSGEFDVTANIQASNVSFSLEGTVRNEGGTGTARIGITSYSVGSLASAGDCSINVIPTVEDGPSVKAGAVWASYTCIGMTRPPGVSCDVRGEFFLEKCGS